MPAQFAQYAPNLELMLDLPLDVSVELGHAELPLAHVLGLKAGSVVQLDRLPGEPLDLLVNGQLVARGEIVVLNDTFAFRVTDLIED
jgi:flagellar motor switch protein FliN/FliY